jgi:hypothetical protein
MILPVFENIQQKVISHPLVNMCSYGDIQLYNNKKTIKYPFVNLDIISSNLINNVSTYSIRMYVCDRNETPFIAYNKCETIAVQIMKNFEQNNVKLNYFTLDFKDVVDGVFVDFNVDVVANFDCEIPYDVLSFDKLLSTGYTMDENGDIIIN